MSGTRSGECSGRGLGKGRSVVKGSVSVCVCRVNRAEENENKLWLVGKCVRAHACVHMFVHVCMCACVHASSLRSPGLHHHLLLLDHCGDRSPVWFLH